MMKIKIIVNVLVFLMAVLQGVYAIYAFFDPVAFSELRGTELFSASDSDWIVIYASRTLFVALVVGFLLFKKQYKLLVWISLFGTVMPITDAWLAYQAGAPSVVVYKHVATVIYLIVTLVALKLVLRSENNA
ncbi:DUF4267 domain-containing protein [Agarilytica rhodophyticola]|uniref:DUF4267 domain-containing protein n=1 Tax=Agarilytica rhodophyticola TaxID=1737490 RepID=UPI001C1F77A5|nr:DUF4267 domain-containing protein [Agarilytica rhodophyticola]